MVSMPVSSKKSLPAPFLRSFSFLFVTTSIAAFFLFFGVRLLQGSDLYDSPIIVSDGYHSAQLWEIAAHPFSFLLTISMFSALSAALWIATIVPKARRFQSLQALFVPWVALVLTSPVWGLIWSMYRWPPQGFSEASVMMKFYQHDIMVGLTLGWLSAILSFPINILSYATVYVLILLGKRLFSVSDTDL